jgi:hypothetical protein
MTREQVGKGFFLTGLWLKLLLVVYVLWLSLLMEAP